MRRYLQDHFVQWMFLSSLFINGVIWAILLYFLQPSEIPILLRYNVYLGFDLHSLVPWHYALSIPLAGLILLLVNVLVSFLFFRKKDFFASYIILFGGVLVQASAIVSVVAIVLVNQ